MEHKAKAGHRWKISLPILLLVAILLVTVVGTVVGWKLTVRNTQATQLEAVEHSAMVLRDELERQFAILDGYSASFTRANIENHMSLLEKLNRFTDNTEFALVCFAYPDGTLYRNDNAQVNVSERQYFQLGMQGERSVEFLVNTTIDSKGRVGLAVPVFLEEAIEGVLLGLHDEGHFRDLFERTFAEVSTLAYLCDSTGQLIIGTESAEQFLDEHNLEITEDNSLTQILDESVFSEGSEEQVKEQMRAGQPGQAIYQFEGVRHHTTYVPLGINDWYVVAVLHEDQIYEDALGMVGIFYALIFLAMLVVLLIIIYLLYRERKLALQEKQKAEDIRYRFEHDDLTGLLSEKAFLEQVGTRLPDIQPDTYCLIYFDIYKFKLINEMFGYDKGNALLCAMAEELKKLEQHYDGLCGRISGDSFVLFLPYQDEVMQQFHTKKYRENRIVPLELYLHYGIYVIHDTEIPVNLMIDAAHIAQKTVKGNYDDCISYYDEKVKEKLLKEQEIITSMAKALEDGEFIVYLQPQYNYETGAVCGAEALVRWSSPTKGLISPGDFIPIFETNGFISRLDEYIWERVCQLQRQWLDEGKDVLPLSVNISRADLLQGAIADKLMSLIRKYDLTPDLLRVEITESAYMDHPQKLIAETNRLAECGFIVEMDDFGSGYSSLNMLKDVPFHVLKTDLKFLSATGNESRKDRILDNIIRMAHEMGMLVIAEGVETKEQADYLLSLHCTQMQGYYFARPLPVEQYEALAYPNEPKK